MKVGDSGRSAKSRHNPTQEQESAWQRQKEDSYRRWRAERLSKSADWLGAARSDQQRMTRKATLARLVSRQFAADAWAMYWSKWREKDGTE